MINLWSAYLKEFGKNGYWSRTIRLGGRFKLLCWYKQSQTQYRQLNQTIFDFEFWWNVQTESGDKGKERTGWINVKDRERLGNDLMPEGNNVRGEDYKKGEVHGRYLQTHYYLHLHNMVLY